MNVLRWLTPVAFLALIHPVALAQAGNLLRNADFQDDWITLLPEMKNHHWNYSSEFYHRRDFNPDGWTCKGSWQWLNAEQPAGKRRFVVTGPGEFIQHVPWVAIHDDRALSGFPDAGGFPTLKSARSQRPEALLRDLSLSVRLSGQNLPPKAGTVEIAIGPAIAPGSEAIALGKSIASASVPLPEGTYADREIEVKLPASAYLQAVKALAAKDPKEAAESAKAGIELPGCVQVAIRYTGKMGRIELLHADLNMTSPSLAANLLANGGFETLDKTGYPAGWSQAIKYRYFPPGLYYIFNTWHNTRSPNRGFAAADALLPHSGKHSLRMIVASGDEMAVVSEPIVLNQKDARLIEVTAMVKTDQLCMLQIDARDQDSRRLDGFNFINKAPHSIGTDSWRLIRQVFKPRTPVKSLRLKLCARGVNGYTLDDTGFQPQNNVVGTIWWDDVRVNEPESTPAELAARGVKLIADPPVPVSVHLADLDLGERLLGDSVLRASVMTPDQPRTVSLEWSFTSPSGKTESFKSKPYAVAVGKPTPIELPYRLSEPCPTAYTEYKGRLSLLDEKGQPIAASDLWFGTWTVPIDLELGALYLEPQQKQYVRLNFGFSAVTMAGLKNVRLDLIGRGSGKVLKTWMLDASPAAIEAQRKKIPVDLRDDFANLLLGDVDVSSLPVQPFADPQRNWLLRATALSADGKIMGQVDSQPLCRLAHETAQPPIQSITIKRDLLYVNGQPWLPWGVTYGHNPVYAGPADPGPGKYHDLTNLPAWSLYDRHSGNLNSRKLFDFNCLRYVAGSITDAKILEKLWQSENLYCSTAFATPDPVFSMDELFKKGGGKDKLDANLAYYRKAPMVVSVTPGIEEAFGLFHTATPAQIKGMEQAVDYLRKQSGRPVMVGHGGYYNLFEFERVPFFDIFDPETEPLYPANIHTDITPIIKGKDKVIWLRPQMYESVPYERWRFHVYVEMMRGCRGWQVAHGMGDTSLMRGLHGEVEFMKPILASPDPGPKIEIEPWIEHWSRRHGDKVYIIAATTRGMALGSWQASDDAPSGSKKSRLTMGKDELRDESNAYGAGIKTESGPACHGIQYLPDARDWPAGTKLAQWVKLDAKSPPKNLVVLVKADGRWAYAASWGKTDLSYLKKDPDVSYWFLNVLYRHAKGFLGWGRDLLPKAMDYIPGKTVDMGPPPAAGEWVKLEVPFDKLGATGKLVDGVAFLHDDGRVYWGRTSFLSSDDKETLVWGDSIELPGDALEKVTIRVPGLKAGTKVRVLFEDREITSADGAFTDDFRGFDWYQRHGGGFGAGYGPAPVAVHLYEMTAAKK